MHGLAKLQERIGRLKEKSQGVGQHYEIELIADPTGENAIAFNAARVGCIAGPVGIVIPNSMMGEISPAIATAVASSDAVKVLIPLQQVHVEFVGVESKPLSTMLDQLADRIAAILAREEGR